MRARTWIPGILAGLAVLWALLIVLPSFRDWLWKAHLVAVETSLLGMLFGIAGVLSGLLIAYRHPGEPHPALIAVAGVSALVCLGPFVSGLLAYEGRATFSLREYVAWGPPLSRGVTVDRDVVLDPAHPDLRTDIYRPAQPGTARRPLLVAVHGGSWRGGEKGLGHAFWRQLVDLGFVVADVSYRLAPAHPFPAAVQDVKCLLGRLRERADTLGIDPGRVALHGRSAGGQIALLAAYSAGDARIPPGCPVSDAPVQAVISLYGPTDLAWGHANPQRPDVVHGPESLELYLGGTPAEKSEAYRLASPQSWLHRPVPRTLLVHGVSDRLVSVEHARRLQAASAGRTPPPEVVLVPAGDHGFDVRPGGVGEQLARAVMLRFLAETVGAP